MLDPLLYDIEYHKLYSSDAPSPIPPIETAAPTSFRRHSPKRYHDAIDELFDNVDGMTVIGEIGDDENETAVWVYHINILKGSVEFIAILFTILTCLLMFNQIGLHLTYNEHKGFRTYTVRILLMVPIYSITSYCGLHNPSNAIVWAMIRDCYECVVLLSFLQYCLTYLGGPENVARYLVAKQHSDSAVPTTVDSAMKRASRSSFDSEDLTIDNSDDASYNSKPKKKKKKKKYTHAHHPKLCWLFCPCAPVWKPWEGEWTRPWALGAEFVRLSLLGTLQYIPFSLLVTLAGLIGKCYGVYHDGRFTFDDVYLYAILVRNWSQCWALYCLGLFYVTLHDELEDIRPVLKFSVIKLVVLFMWWQGVFVNVLEQSEGMKAADDGLLDRGWTTKEVGFCIQNFLCIIEMLFIAIGMHYAFHYSEWASDEVNAAHKGTSPWTAFFRGKVVSTMRDVMHDARSVKDSVKDATKGKFSRVSLDDDPTWDPSNPSPPNRFHLPSRLLTKKDRDATARLFTEGVNFADIFKSLREINTLERTLEEEEDQVVAGLEKGHSKTAKDNDSETEFIDAQGEDNRSDSPSLNEVRRMAEDVRRSVSRSREKASDGKVPIASTSATEKKDDEERMVTVQPISGDPLLVKAGKHDTVAHIKAKVSKVLGFPIARLNLVVEGKVLKDLTVATLVIPEGAVVHLSLLNPPKKSSKNDKETPTE